MFRDGPWMVMVLAGVICFGACSSSPKEELSPEARAIEARLMEHKDEIARCYEAEKDQKSGKVETQFVIDPAGAVTQARIKESSLHMPKVEKCVLNTLQKIRFRKPGKGEPIKVTYPFNFFSE